MLESGKIHELQTLYHVAIPEIRDLIPVLAIKESQGYTEAKLGWLKLGGEPMAYRRFLFFIFKRPERPTDTLFRRAPEIYLLCKEERVALGVHAEALRRELTGTAALPKPLASVHAIPRIASA